MESCTPFSWHITELRIECEALNKSGWYMNVRYNSDTCLKTTTCGPRSSITDLSREVAALQW